MLSVKPAAVGNDINVIVDDGICTLDTIPGRARSASRMLASLSGQASAGAIPPIVTRVGKEVVTVEGGDDFTTQAGEDKTAMLVMPDGPGEEVTVGAIPPIARLLARVVPTRRRRSGTGHCCFFRSKFFMNRGQCCKIGVHGVLRFSTEQIGPGRAIVEGRRARRRNSHVGNT